jgi:hypothetical protein
VRLAETAARLLSTPRPEVLDTLAIAYAADGRFSDAARTSDEAAALARAAGREALAVEIDARTRRYRRGGP